MASKRVDVLSIVLQLAAFVAIYLILGTLSWPLLGKLLLAIALSILFGAIIKRAMRKTPSANQRQTGANQPPLKRVRVYSSETVDPSKD